MSAVMATSAAFPAAVFPLPAEEYRTTTCCRRWEAAVDALALASAESDPVLDGIAAARPVMFTQLR